MNREPAAAEVRCIMGYPLGDEYVCWNDAGTELFCATCTASAGCNCPGCTRPYPPVLSEGDTE